MSLPFHLLSFKEDIKVLPKNISPVIFSEIPTTRVTLRQHNYKTYKISPERDNAESLEALSNMQDRYILSTQ